jgi:hypothetical protein
MRIESEPGLDALLSLHGEVFVIDPPTGTTVRFIVHRVPPSAARPHGIAYSLTMHDRQGRRIVGFDNAHAVAVTGGPRGRSRAFDHRHARGNVRPDAYTDAAKLLADFWDEVYAELAEREAKR